jgi:hypothetical protein
MTERVPPMVRRVAWMLWLEDTPLARVGAL